MDKDKKKMNLKVKAVLMFAMAVAFSFTAGAFMYATGNAVVDDGFTLFMVSHTEYRYAETGQIVARLVDFQGTPITVDNCTTTILYPDKTKFVDEALMTDTVNISGDHYYSFTTPNGPEGVYEYQATCYWSVGATVREQSVTNSFHLSNAFGMVLNNLTQLSTDLAAVNSSLSGEITQIYNDLSAQLNANISTVLSGQTDIQNQLNSNVTTILDALTAMNSSLVAEIQNISVDVNLTPVLDAIDALEVQMAANFTAVFSEFTVVNTKLDAINVTVDGISTDVTTMAAVLDYVNTTTSNTYDYVTGTLATNVNNILTQMGVLNATVNRIETNTVEINTTVASIKQTQEDAVQMTVFSG